MTSLLKKELNYQILNRRLSEGCDELTLDLQAAMSRLDERVGYEKAGEENSVLREEIKRLSSDMEMTKKIITEMSQEQTGPFHSPQTNPVSI